VSADLIVALQSIPQEFRCWVLLFEVCRLVLNQPISINLEEVLAVSQSKYSPLLCS
jgi:hypothetical protein